MYTSYSLWLIITSMVLLLAMVGAIVITIKLDNPPKANAFVSLPLQSSIFKQFTAKNIIIGAIFIFIGVKIRLAILELDLSEYSLTLGLDLSEYKELLSDFIAFMFISGPLYIGVPEDFMGPLSHPRIAASGNTGGSGNIGGSGDKGGSGNGGGSDNKGGSGNSRGYGLSYEYRLELSRAQAIHNVLNAPDYPILGAAVDHLEEIQREMAQNQIQRLNSLQARLVAAQGAGASPSQINGIRAQIVAVNSSYRPVHVQDIEMQGIANIIARRRQN